MQLRTMESGTRIGVLSEDGTGQILISNEPGSEAAAVVRGTVVLMPERALVTLVDREDEANSQCELVALLAGRLKDEVRSECGADCEADVATYTQIIQEIGLAVLAAGVVCEKADSCGRSCPPGIRADL